MPLIGILGSIAKGEGLGEAHNMVNIETVQPEPSFVQNLRTQSQQVLRREEPRCCESLPKFFQANRRPSASKIRAKFKIWGRIQPSVPMKKCRFGSMTHDYE